MVHYQFEMIHPFEQYNGIVGRIVISMILHDIIRDALPLMCLSEYMYHNKNEYFDLLRTTQYSGGYIRWIKFFINAIQETTKQSAELLIQYESIISEDEYHLKENGKLPKSILAVYNYLKSFPITNITITERNWNYLSTRYQKHLICCKSMELLKIMRILSEIGFLDMLSWKN